MQAAEPIDDLMCGSLVRRPVGDVDLDGDRAAPDLLGGGLGSRPVDVGARDGGAPFGEHAGGRRTDSRAGAGDDGDPAVQDPAHSMPAATRAFAFTGSRSNESSVAIR